MSRSLLACCCSMRGSFTVAALQPGGLVTVAAHENARTTIVQFPPATLTLHPSW